MSKLPTNHCLITKCNNEKHSWTNQLI